MGQVHPRTIALKDLVDRAQVVVEAQPGTPDHRVEEVPTAPDARTRQPGPFSPFSRVRWRYVVRAVLAGGADAPAVGASLEVDQAHWRRDLGLHRRFVLEGLLA